MSHPSVRLRFDWCVRSVTFGPAGFGAMKAMLGSKPHTQRETERGGRPKAEREQQEWINLSLLVPLSFSKLLHLCSFFFRFLSGSDGSTGIALHFSKLVLPCEEFSLLFSLSEILSFSQFLL